MGIQENDAGRGLNDGVRGEKGKPRVIAACANKGGVGKTRVAILEANYLAALGKKVLVMDMDFNNSATIYYLREEAEHEIARKNVAEALSREENPLGNYAITTVHKGLSFIPSSRYLADLRSINEKRLSRMINSLNGLYDFVIIDCQPDYNNLTLNAINASDIIITPVLKDLDSYNAAQFLGQKIAIDTDKKDSWFITINGYNRQYENSSGGKQKEYLEIYKKNFRQITNPSAWYPWTADMNDIKDKKMLLSKSPRKGAVCNKLLYDAVASLAESFLDEDIIQRPEVF
jgi:chromosome partitioning protein